MEQNPPSNSNVLSFVLFFLFLRSLSLFTSIHPLIQYKFRDAKRTHFLHDVKYDRFRVYSIRVSGECIYHRLRMRTSVRKIVISISARVASRRISFLAGRKNLRGEKYRREGKKRQLFLFFFFLSWKEWRNEVCSWLNDFKNFKCFVYVNYFRHIVGRFERCEKMMMETRSDEGNVGSPRVWLNN